MGIHRLSDRAVSRLTTLACAIASVEVHARVNPLRTADAAAVLICLLFTSAPISVLGAAKNRSAIHLPGFNAVRVHYGPLNKMIMSVRINGYPAKLLVDTGASQVILDKDVAESAGVKPFQRALNQVRFSVPSQVFTMGSEINGQLLPVGMAQNITAGSMNFGNNPVALRDSSHSRDSGAGRVDGILGLDILLRYKAVVNCRTKLIFFKVDQARRINLSAIAASEKFTRVPMQREENGVLTVLCSIRGQPARLLVDTGAFVTTLDEAFVKSLGIGSEPTRISAQFGRGESKRISAARINDLRIGAFKVPSEKLGVARLPNFALRQGNSRIVGILGMDTLYIHRAIVDLDGMNLFLK
ncbi:MAG: aspartyl protease family protein [Alphaproteobacteria bacterium]